MMETTPELEQEEDGRWIAELSSLPGALAYGASREEAVSMAEALVQRILADRLKHGEVVPDCLSDRFDLLK